MKKSSIIFLLLALSGCTHVMVSNSEFLSDVEKSVPNEKLQDFPLNINSDMICERSTGAPAMGGVSINTYCSNKERISAIDKIFKDRGFRIVPSDDLSSPQISIHTDKINGFLEQTTGFLSLLTLGILPMYSYTDYIVSYTSPKDNINVSRKVRVSSTNSWFSLFLSNPKNLKEDQIEFIVERNIIRAVLDDANIVKPKSI